MAQDPFEDRFPIAVHRVPVRRPRPVRTKMAEEAALRVRLHAEDVPVPVAQGRNVERGPARVPRVCGIRPAVVDEPEHHLIVCDELFQNPLLAVLREQELAFGMSGDEGDDLALLQGPREGARTRVLHPKQAGPAFVMARVVRREDCLRLFGHDAAQGGQQTRLDEDLKAVAHAEHGLAGLHEADEVLRKPRPHAGREDRPRPDVVARGEPARDHEDVVVVEVAPQVRGCIPGQLLQVDLLRLGAEMTEVGDGLVLAVRALDVDDGHPNLRPLHETTTCFGIASLHAFRITGIAREVHWRPRPRWSDGPPVVPRYVVGIPSIRCVKASYRSFGISTSQRPFDSEKSSTSQRIGSIAVVLRSAPISPPRHISAAATARPPWLRSCAAATVPARIARRRWSIDARNPIGSTEGTGAVPPRSRRYSEPPSSACVEPTKTTGSPARLKSDVTQCRRSSTIPTPRTTGVGGHRPRLDSFEDG